MGIFKEFDSLGKACLYEALLNMPPLPLKFFLQLGIQHNNSNYNSILYFLLIIG